MRFTWNRPPQNLNEILGVSSKPLPAKTIDGLAKAFGRVVAGHVQSLSNVATNEEELYQEVFCELTSLLLSRYEDWGRLTSADIKKLIADLVVATNWKLRIKEYVFPVTTAELAGEGMSVLSTLKGMLNDFLADKQESMRKSLVRNYIDNEADAYAVTERALRCLVAYLRHNHRTKQTIFVWDKNYQLVLNEPLMEVYLYEQLALYAYLFKGEPRALFLNEIRIVLRKYVNSKVSGQDRDVIVKDIIQDIFMAFFYERDSYGKDLGQFFVDKRLSSYFVGLARQKKIIDKYRINYEKSVDIQFYEEDLLMEEDDEFSDELARILKHCHKGLNTDCQKIYTTRVLGDYSEKISIADAASILKIPYRTLEKQVDRCDSQLRECVINNSKQIGFRL